MRELNIVTHAVVTTLGDAPHQLVANNPDRVYLIFTTVSGAIFVYVAVNQSGQLDDCVAGINGGVPWQILRRDLGSLVTVDLWECNSAGFSSGQTIIVTEGVLI